MKLYTSKICPYAQRVHIALVETLSFNQLAQIELVEIDLANKPDWYRNINPQLKVPAFQIGETVMIESLAITEYILEEFGRATNILPTDPLERYYMRLFIEQFSSWVVTQFYALLRAKSEHDQEKAKSCLLWAIKQMSDKIKGPFVMGANFTFADIACIPWVLRFDALEQIRGFSIPNTPEYARFNQWVAMCCSRDSIRRTRMIKDEHVAGQAKFAVES
ncbi:hypothetical protein HDV03_004970 [Kappamyces sp. JEL0829]|nr:hypothetical protein HDV03_004970 [Kappamyces sp. JEL0829]KAJ3362307.1 hypothetical protein HDU91_003485 [Kappamyces sp. JEL0680]